MKLFDLPREAPVIEPGVTLRSVSEEVADRVLVGLGNVGRLDRPVPDAVLPDDALLADGFGIGSARDHRKGADEMSERGLFGLSGSFASPDALTEAAQQLRSLGFREVEAYTPIPGRRPR
jgi:hypothetical protein